MFKMLRKQLPKYPDVLLLILSARYGLIGADEPIQEYEHRIRGMPFDMIPNNVWNVVQDL